LGDDLEAVVLFGSQARGEARAGSDVDLLVVVSERREIDRSLYRLWDECNGATVVNPHFVHLPGDVFEAGSLWFEIAIEGIVLEDREGNVNRFLSRVRRAIANGQIRRGSVHGRPYWVKQEGGTDAQ
jgi:predicted nucleotidyltransferase